MIQEAKQSDQASCSFPWEWLLQHAVLASEQREQVVDHIAQCKYCANTFNAMSHTDAELRDRSAEATSLPRREQKSTGSPEEATADQWRRVDEADILLRPQLAAGHHAAFELLIGRYRLRLFSFVQSRMTSFDAHELDDIVQEVFLRLWEGRRQLATTGSLYALLRAIAHKTAVDYLRRRQLRRHCQVAEELPSQAPSPAQEAYGQELEHHLGNALAKLTKLQRTSLELKSAGLSAKEIAGQQGCSPQAAKRRWQSAVQRLRRQLNIRTPDDNDDLA